MENQVFNLKSNYEQQIREKSELLESVSRENEEMKANEGK